MQTVVSFATTPAGGVAQETFTVFNGGGAALSLSNFSLPAGYGLVSGGFGVTPVTVEPGGSTQFVLQENTAAVGTLTGTVTFATNDSAENNSFSFPLTGTVSPLVINDGGAGWATPTGNWTLWTGQGYAGDDHEAAANSTATWTFSGLAAGNYLVYATWPAQRNRADNVPYTVAVGGGGSVTNVLVDQKNAPPASIAGSGPAGGVWSWQQLGATSYTVAAGGTLVVGVSSAGADGCVEADAVMLVPTQPELAAGGLGHNPNAPPLTANAAMPLVYAAEARWAAAGANVSALGSVQVSVVNLPGTELGESSSVVDTIFLDVNAKGYGWFIDPTPGQDNEFPVPVSKTQERAASGPVAGQMDLLTVIMHEMGHFLGHEDLDPQASPYDLMSADLPAGVRRLPQSAAIAPVAQAERSGPGGRSRQRGC